MVSLTSLAVGLLAVLAPAADATGRTRIAMDGLAVARMDPIVQPGKVAGHAHNIFGASNFRNVLNSPEEQQRASCTSANIQVDKSNYWIPQLYFINKNGTYTLLKHSTLVYYQWDAGESTQKVQAFPQGMRMVTGLANERVPGDIKIQGLHNDFWHFGTNPTNLWYFPNGTHQSFAPPDNQIVTAIRFPRCGWANASLDSADHFSHMTWPVRGVDDDWTPTGGACPDTHPIMYPGLLFETFWKLEDYMVSDWNTAGPNVILSNGDTTGITYHADFLAGWDNTVLQAAIDQCASVEDSVDPDGCPPLKEHIRPETYGWCRFEGTIPAEDVGLYKALDKLPGCNPRWDWDGPDSKPTDCDGNVASPGFVSASRGRTDWIDHTYPLAIPGLSADETSPAGSGLQPGSGNGIVFAPFLSDWATLADQTSDAYQRGPVMSGSQADVDAAANGGETLSVVAGQADSSAWAGETGSGLATDAAAGAANSHTTRTYQCEDKPGYEGFACPAAALAAAGNGTGEVVGTSSSSTSSVVSSDSSSSSSAATSSAAIQALAANVATTEGTNASTDAAADPQATADAATNESTDATAATTAGAADSTSDSTAATAAAPAATSTKKCRPRSRKRDGKRPTARAHRRTGPGVHRR